MTNQSKKDSDIIGWNKYNHLKSKDPIDLTDDERTQIEKFEKARNPEPTPEQREYGRKVWQYVAPEQRELTGELLLKGYDAEIQKRIHNPNSLIKANEADRIMIETLAAWISKDERFINSPIIKNRPDTHKNLLLIGGYGNGKSTALQIMARISSKTKTPINYTETKGVVDEYDGLSGTNQKRGFWIRMKTRDWIFDDLMSERMASNYGKVELFTDILEGRSNPDKYRTCICCNPPLVNGKIGGYKDTLNAIGNRYGGRVYDRIHLYNHVFIDAKSMRR